MSKLFLFILLMLSTFSLWASCPNKIDPKKVMLFIDANYGDQEIAAAQNSACQRGERLEVMPKNWRDYSALTKSVETAQAKVRDCWKTNPPDATKCQPQQAEYEAKNNQLRTFVSTQPNLKENLKKRMEELSKEKVQLTNVSISGHDGGGSFGGFKGNISRGDIAEILNQYPEMNTVESLLLLGCYTGVQQEVASWQGVFPQVKLIGGYDGSAPASSRPQGHVYISNILNKEKQLLNLKNKNTVDNDVKRLISNLGDLNSAVYINLSCQEEDDEFYYASHLDRKFNKLNFSDCEKAQREIQALTPQYMKYFNGEAEPPVVTSEGETRTLYNTLRTYEHCIQQEFFGMNSVSANGAFNLLFWHGVKMNFANYYQDEMKEAEEIIKGINIDSMIESMHKEIESRKAAQADIDKLLVEFSRDPAAFTKKAEQELAELETSAQKVMNNPEYINLMNKFLDQNFKATQEELEFLTSSQNIISAHQMKKWDVELLKKDPMRYKQDKMNDRNWIDHSISTSRSNIAKLEGNPDVLKKIWIPTKENMEKKTRKEVMENLHAINGVMTMGGLPQKQYGALSWVNSVSNSHLQYFQNPFSWHEFTGETEAPPGYRMRLSEFTSDNRVGFGGGYPGSFGSGGMSGGSMGMGF